MAGIPDFNELKEKVMDTMGNVADKARDLAGVAADKAKQGARIAKLSTEISGEKENIKRAYIEIGKLYYENHRDDAEGFFVQLCEEITLAKDNIETKEAEVAQLKNSIRDFDSDSDIEVEFEEVVSEAEEEAGATAETPTDETEAE